MAKKSAPINLQLAIEKEAKKSVPINLQLAIEKEVKFFKEEAQKYQKLSESDKLPNYGKSYYQELIVIANTYASKFDKALTGEIPVIIGPIVAEAPVVETPPLLEAPIIEGSVTETLVENTNVVE
jgi:hypothetical protein